MTCSSGNYGPGVNVGQHVMSMGESGLVSSHAYTLLSAHEVEDAHGVTRRLVRLRNPWGEKEWKGDWCDSSDKWTPELKQKLGWQNKDDGMFFMEFD